MSLPNPPVAVSDAKDVRIVEFTHNKILDEANIKEIGDAILSLVEERDNPKILIDFSTVDHLSSAALGMLINVNGKVKLKNGSLRLANIKSSIREVFVITKLDKLFGIFTTDDVALESLK